MVHFHAISIGLIGLVCFLLHPLFLFAAVSANSSGESYCLNRSVCWTLNDTGTISRKTSKTMFVRRSDLDRFAVVSCKSNWTGSTFRVIRAEQGFSTEKMLAVKSSAVKIIPDKSVQGGLLLSIDFSPMKADVYISWEIEETYNGGMLPNHMGFSPSHLFTDTILVKRDQFEVVVPKGLKFFYVARRMGSKSVPEETEFRGLKSFSWVLHNVLPTPDLPLMPSVYQSVPTVQTSLAANWKLISQWMGGALSKNMEVTSKVRSLITSFRSDPDFMVLHTLGQIEYIVKKVNSFVRYIDVPQTVFTEISGHSVNEVLNKGYGDCVDRAVVLSTLLKALDISSLPVLIGSRNYRPIEPELPSPYAGDHCIVKVNGSFGDFFIDPGAVWERPGKLPVIYQGVVAYSPLTGEFFKTPDSTGYENGIDSEHSIIIHEDGSYRGNYRITVFGDNESLVRAYMDREKSLSKLKHLVSKLLFLPDSATVENVVVNPQDISRPQIKPSDPDCYSESLNLSGSYVFSLPSKRIGGRLAVVLSGYESGGEVIATERPFPLVYRAPVFHRSLMYIECENSDMTIVKPSEVNISTGPVSYSFSSTLEKENLILRSSYVRDTREIMPEDYDGFKKLIEKRAASERAPLIIKSGRDSKPTVTAKQVTAKQVTAKQVTAKQVTAKQVTANPSACPSPPYKPHEKLSFETDTSSEEKSEILLTELSARVRVDGSIIITRQEVIELSGSSSSRCHEIDVAIPSGASVSSYAGGTMNLKTRVVKELLHHEVIGTNGMQILKLHLPSTGGRERLKWNCQFILGEEFTQNFFYQLLPVRGDLPVRTASVQLYCSQMLPLTLEFKAQGEDTNRTFQDKYNEHERVITVTDLRDPRSAVSIMKESTWIEVSTMLEASLKQIMPSFTKIFRDPIFSKKNKVNVDDLNRFWQKTLYLVGQVCHKELIKLSHLQKAWILGKCLEKAGYKTSVYALRLSGIQIDSNLPSARGFEYGLVKCNGQWFSPDLTSASAHQFANYLYGGELLLLTGLEKTPETCSISTFKPLSWGGDVRLVEDIYATISLDGVMTVAVNRIVRGSLAVKLRSLFSSASPEEIELSMAKKLQNSNKGAVVTDFSFSTVKDEEDLKISFQIKVPSSVVRIDEGLHAVTMPFVPVAGDADFSALSRRTVLRIPKGCHLKSLPLANSAKDGSVFESIQKIDQRTVLWEQQLLPVRQQTMSSFYGEKRDFVVPLIEYVSFGDQ
jgi:hypothetical protein